MEKEEFLRLLPKLIMEDNEVKGAIVSALSGVMSTKSDIERLIEHSDKRFEKIDERFEKMDSRFEKMDERFEQIDRRIEKNQEILIAHSKALTQINERVNNLSANYSRTENIRSTEFKTLDGKIDSLKNDVSEIKDLLKNNN